MSASSSRPRKRPHTEDEEAARSVTDSVTASPSSSSSKERWVWLEIDVYDKTKPGHTSKCYYVPEAIIDQIPSYKDQLLKKATAANAWEEHTIRDASGLARPLETVTAVIRFLVSGFLAPLDTSSPTCGKTLDGLVELYKLSIMMSIKCLEVAVLDDINALQFNALPHHVFLVFARSYYALGGVDAQHTTLGHLIKKKLFSLLPHLQKSMTIEDMSTETGILGKQLIAVLLEDRFKGQQMLQIATLMKDRTFAQMRPRVKIEMPDDDET